MSLLCVVLLWSKVIVAQEESISLSEAVFVQIMQAWSVVDRGQAISQEDGPVFDDQIFDSYLELYVRLYQLLLHKEAKIYREDLLRLQSAFQGLSESYRHFCEGKNLSEGFSSQKLRDALRLLWKKVVQQVQLTSSAG